jgi:hypothetical protein
MYCMLGYWHANPTRQKIRDKIKWEMTHKNLCGSSKLGYVHGQV